MFSELSTPDSNNISICSFYQSSPPKQDIKMWTHYLTRNLGQPYRGIIPKYRRIPRSSTILESHWTNLLLQNNLLKFLLHKLLEAIKVAIVHETDINQIQSKANIGLGANWSCKFWFSDFSSWSYWLCLVHRKVWLLKRVYKIHDVNGIFKEIIQAL